MLSAEENEVLCRVGPGSAMGNLLRRYWLPALQSEEVQPDGPPVRVRLLGENLVAFRSTSGTVALIREACPHRGTSLFFGRNEENGLRCAYHGWKFEGSGACVDMPNVPAEHDFKEKVRAVAYPCVERNGVIWTYLGPPPAPQLPELEANLATDREVSIRRVLRRCNWVQALEGEFDGSHLGFAHRHDMTPGEDLHRGVPDEYALVDTEAGSSFASRYAVADPELGATHVIWLISHFLFPFWAILPFGDFGGREIVARAWVPLDDEHTLYWELLVVTEATKRFLQTTQCKYQPATSDPASRFRPVASLENDYLVDRSLQRTSSFMGLDNVLLDDSALTESMGPICDRSREHLGMADAPVIRTRRRLLEAARGLQLRSQIPPGVAETEGYRRRAAKIVLRLGVDVFTAAERLLQPSVPVDSSR